MYSGVNYLSGFIQFGIKIYEFCTILDIHFRKKWNNKTSMLLQCMSIPSDPFYTAKLKCTLMMVRKRKSKRHYNDREKIYNLKVLQ